jgi:rubrerythrin
MAQLKGSKTEDNLKYAFAGESQAKSVSVFRRQG